MLRAAKILGHYILPLKGYISSVNLNRIKAPLKEVLAMAQSCAVGLVIAWIDKITGMPNSSSVKCRMALFIKFYGI